MEKDDPTLPNETVLYVGTLSATDSFVINPCRGSGRAIAPKIQTTHVYNYYNEISYIPFAKKELKV